MRRTLAFQGFYEGRFYKPLWVSDEGINPHGEKLIAALAASGADALDPSEYEVETLTRMASAARSEDDLAALEVTLSNTFVTFADHLTSGRVQPNEVNKALNIFPRAPNPSVVLEYIESAEDLEASLEALSPNTPNYARLKAALARLSRKGGERRLHPRAPGRDAEAGHERCPARHTEKAARPNRTSSRREAMTGRSTTVRWSRR